MSASPLRMRERHNRRSSRRQCRQAVIGNRGGRDFEDAAPGTVDAYASKPLCGYASGAPLRVWRIM